MRRALCFALVLAAAPALADDPGGLYPTSECLGTGGGSLAGALCVNPAAGDPDSICIDHDSTNGALTTNVGDLLVNTAGDDVFFGDTTGVQIREAAVGAVVHITIGGDNNTGVGFPGGDQVHFFTGGSARVGLTSNSFIVFAGTGSFLRSNVANDNTNTALLWNDDTQQTGFHAQATSTIVVAGAAATFVATRNQLLLDCDAGGNTLTSITRPTGISGVAVLWLLFIDASCTINDANDGAADTIDLGVGGNIAPSAVDLLLCLMHNGTSWHECGREQL